MEGFENENFENEDIAFKLILHAGNAKSLAMEAIYESRDGNFDESEQKLQEAEKELTVAHKCQSKMIFAESNGKQHEAKILLSHAMDHMAMATISYEMAEEIVLLRKERGDKK